MNSTIRAAESSRVGNYRWSICALLFFATTINYVDRQVISLLKPVLQGEFGWSEIDYSNIVFAFQIAYAVGLLLVGRVIDRFGVHKGFSFAVVVWSLAAMAHAIPRTVFGFSLARFALGLGEAANFPASIKTVAEWHPRKERALATGIFNAGSNIGIIVAALIVPLLTEAYGWRGAFIVTGALGFVWLAAWAILYAPPEKQRRLSAAELAHIRSDTEVGEKSVPWLSIIGYRQAWAFALGKLLTDPIWWVYIFWIPDFLYRNYGLSLSQIGVPLVTIYLIADVGSVGGGWISSTLIRRGWTVNQGRKTAMLLC